MFCGKGKAEPAGTVETVKAARGIPLERKQRFSGNYNKEFNDLQDLHLTAAVAGGISPMASRDDTLKLKDELVRLPNELELYKMYDLTHSIPFLVPSAAQLFVDIAQNFRDSLYSKDLPLYRLYLTSILRTDDDLSTLTKRNINASENSTHRYGTTFDVSWKRFDQVTPDSIRQVPPERLKLVLAQVLFDLKNQQRCYVKHERKQACFHITVR
ncbi:MAG: hypothetical protein BGO33_14630 [Bacteroidia bacterium 43-41]|nr:MAG: hypothetical protein BGO33_14630 [Bacteroidia bacterium 43-41]